VTPGRKVLARIFLLGTSFLTVISRGNQEKPFYGTYYLLLLLLLLFFLATNYRKLWLWLKIVVNSHKLSFSQVPLGITVRNDISAKIFLHEFFFLSYFQGNLRETFFYFTYLF
jgi:hypothetical protein